MRVATWLPLAFVVIALVALLSVPIVVNHRTRELWRQLDEGNRVRVLLNDLEAAGATEALIAARPAGSQVGPSSAADSLEREAARAAMADDRELDSLLRDASPAGRRDLSTIDSIERSWRAARAGGRAHKPIAPDDPIRLIAAAERFDDYLMRRLDSLRTQSRELQNVTVVSAVVLAPIALLSVLAVFWAGIRSQRLARRLELEREALARSIETRAALVRGITHDLKNPLGAATGYVDLLLDGVGNDPLAASHVTVLARVRRLLSDSIASISSLLDLARVDSSEALTVAAGDVDVRAMVHDVVEDYRAAARERQLTLDVEEKDNVGVVVTDARHLRHILGNLMSNALKYTPERGRVRVQLSRATMEGSGMICISVCDTGPGVPRSKRDAIFEEFTRLDTTATATDGHGVGLSISRRLARMLGGDLTVGDAPDGGAMFTLMLPVVPHAGGAQRHTAGSSVPSTQTE